MGQSGEWIGHRLLTAGFDLVILSPDRACVDGVSLQSRGNVLVVDSMFALLAQATVVVSLGCDAHDQHQLAVETGSGNLSSGHVWIDLAAVDIPSSLQIHQERGKAGCQVLDAWISRGASAQPDDAPIVAVGGDPAVIASAQSVLSALGDDIIHVGGPGTSQVARMVHEVAVAVTHAGLREALRLGERSGVSSMTVLEVLGGGLAASAVIEALKEQQRSATPSASSPMAPANQLVDVLAAALAYGVPLPVTALVAQAEVTG